MLLNLINQENFLIINYNLIKSFGAETATYITVLYNIFIKASRKNKLDSEGYFTVVRKYITDLVGISSTKQHEIDKILQDSSVDILNVKIDNQNAIKLNIDKLFTVIENITDDDVKILKKNIKESKTSISSLTRASAKENYAKYMKSFVTYDNQELQNAMYNWIDLIVNNFGANSKMFDGNYVNRFQTELDNFSQGDLDLALKIIDIASSKLRRECSWAINDYRRDSKEYLQKKFTHLVKNEEPLTDVNKIIDKTIAF